jgi:oxygen-independent coproporphyrinogen-3 oxidase
MRRCGYCAFATVAVGARLDPDTGDRFVDTLEREIDLRVSATTTELEPLESVYLGGGTPTMLSPAALGRVVSALRDRVGLSPDVEITVEANPDGLAAGQLAAMRDAGVTRVSFGLQSVRRHVLDLLDRTHDPDQALAAVKAAHAAGFEHVSLDLIHGTPGERDDDWAATVEAAATSGADHVSAYALTVEAGTKLAARVRHGELAEPSGDEAARRYRMADERLVAAGFDWYELSNWARQPAARSRHNLLYWRNGDWWGLGPSAHSHLGGRRWRNHRALDRWAAAVARGELPVADEELLDDQQRRLEDVLLGVRLAEGLRSELVPEPAAVDPLVLQGLLERRGDRFVLTMDGRLLADLVVRRLVGA